MALPYATPPRGSCTLAQTAFNAINMLLGIGVLAMPFAFRIAGWGGGLLLTWLLLAVTRYTALLIGRIMDTAVIQRADGRYTGVMSYADLGFVAFGRVGHTLIGSLFMMELFGASVALLILSADSFAVLWPEVAVVHIKWLIFGVMVVTTIPRRFNIFGYTSLLGIVALVNLACILIYNGLAYDGVPGSLRHPAPTTWLPPQWFPVPLTFGLVMAGYCSHSVFPSMYREMAQPAEYPRVVNIAYAVTGLFTMLIAVAGYLMFGDQTLEEITLNLATVNGYPRRLTALAVFLIGVNPLTKFGLTVNPIAQNLEAWLARCCAQRGGPLRRPLRTALAVAIVVTACYFPGFHQVMALLGSLLAFTISVMTPCIGWWRLAMPAMARREQAWLGFCLVLSVIGIVLGTAWAILPLHLTPAVFSLTAAV
ncbi:hypothetical protein CXG81DRAFT_11749 [Caulochytrium protostelioides]|uniref:Amino acid transporter transmembrane domain-containing protein n=1 Tax=Caulochytrium protostelioides TaxID=1555241 RepID=A0A4P9WZC7_9FUNG|nr:hypothetical protein CAUPRSCDRAFT_5727 [Caulochytrium protostelioides]RKP01604.1 hypothetical protein CXG81DRAFT_11749 [Caulochytrium protostelioides]|eukprot:RKP01604.1 hypothetical protein CXG81DRAFT_11749 [Caulochytrium protostelioides]